MKATGNSMFSATEISNIRDEANWENGEDRNAMKRMDRILVKTDKLGKKKKTKGGDEFDYSLKPDIPLRLNYDRYGVIMRDELVIKAARDRWNRGAAEVVRALLEVALNEESEMAEPRTERAVGVNEIVERIPQNDYPLLPAGIAGSSSKSIPDIVRQYLAVMSGDDLAGGSGAPFLSKIEGNNPQYTVELEAICVKLRAGLMMELVRERLGDRAARVLATVAKAHKITEQAVS